MPGSESPGELLVVVLIIALASYRITRVITQDTLLHEPREALLRWAWNQEADPPVPNGRGWRTYAYELLTCSFCLGVWVTAGVGMLWAWGPEWMQPVLAVTAACGGQAYIASRPGA